jgi:uncharacterized protein
LKRLTGILCLLLGYTFGAIGESYPATIEQGYIESSTEQYDSPAVNPPPLANIVLILDDLGNSVALGQRAIQLPGDINYSFLPQSPNGARLAKFAHLHGKEIMLHIPMSNIHGKRMGPGALTPAMEKEQFIATLRENLHSIPHVRGVNNHMGSLLTQLHQPMTWFMQELKQQKLYFIDSRTSPLTVAESTAKTYKLPHMRRHVFLDNLRTQPAISKQFERLVSMAKLQGTAVAIAHPHPETLSFLEHALPALSQRGVRLVFASEMLNKLAGSCPANNCPKLSQLTHLVRY